MNFLCMLGCHKYKVTYRKRCQEHLHSDKVYTIRRCSKCGDEYAQRHNVYESTRVNVDYVKHQMTDADKVKDDA
jgi:DNA-directed RNA polymerase subunit M/transcription elongation factor TFIIS